MTTPTQSSPDRLRSEKILAGAMILDSRVIDYAVTHGVNPASVADDSARAIITACLDRHAKAQPCDVTTITAASGLDWGRIEGCIDLVPTTTEGAYYAERVSRYADLDRFAMIGPWITRKVTAAGPDDAPAIAAEISSAVDRAIQAGRLMTAGTLSAAAVTWLDRMTAPDGANVMLDWPLDAITSEMGRLDREVVWIIAQPSIGKTAFVLQWCLRLAFSGHPVSLASLESSAESIASRAIAQIAPMNNYQIRQRRARPEQIREAYEAARRIPDLMRITDGSMTLDQLYAWGKSEARKGSRMIVVDNTRHIRIPGRMADRINMVAEISTRMKQLRDDTGVPVVILHHSAVDKQTGIESASWSSDIRKDADIMVYLKRDADLSREPQSPQDHGLHAVRFSVDKNREGRAGYDILTRFRKEWQLFERWGNDEDRKDGEWYDENGGN
jgi:replicative DNA helicase